MRIFKDNDEWLTTEFMEDTLRQIAEDEAKEGEYHAEEHTCWIAAEMINKLVKIVEGKTPEVFLRELADQLETARRLYNEKDGIEK